VVKTWGELGHQISLGVGGGGAEGD
jgi:hypothetical protein